MAIMNQSDLRIENRLKALEDAVFGGNKSDSNKDRPRTFGDGRRNEEPLKPERIG